MEISNYVEQILNNPVYVFDTIIEKIIGKNIHFTKIELSRHSIKMDSVLIESIKSILSDLEKEEGVISHWLYLKFGVEIRKNKRRKQLIYLGSELKMQQTKIKMRLDGFHRQKEKVSYSIINLERLVEGLENQNVFCETKTMKNKNMFFISEVKFKIKELRKLQLLLLMKYDNLSEIEKIYHIIFKSIPQHEKLHEETQFLLAKRVKK